MATGQPVARWGMKLKAVGDSLDASEEVLVETGKAGAETKGSWELNEVILPTFPFGLKLALVRTRLKAGGTLDRAVTWPPSLRLWTFSGENGENFVAGVP